jgi:hypothetical protein
VLDKDRTALAEFITVGIEPEQEDRIGARPTGRGVLGLLISDPSPSTGTAGGTSRQLRIPARSSTNDLLSRCSDQTS